MTAAPTALVGRWLWSPETQTAMVVQSITFDEDGHSYATVHDGLGERDPLGILLWAAGCLTLGICEKPDAPLDAGAGWVAYFALDGVESRADLPDGVSWVFDGKAPSRVD